MTTAHAETISLRTARSLVGVILADGNAFAQMPNKILLTEPQSYDTLVGRSFTDVYLPASDSTQSEKEE